MSLQPERNPLKSLSMLRNVVIQDTHILLYLGLLCTNHIACLAREIQPLWLFLQFLRGFLRAEGDFVLGFFVLIRIKGLGI